MDKLSESKAMKTLQRVFDWSRPFKKHVYFFNEGSADDHDLLGHKGANLCEMYRLGLSVPFGFVISNEACLDFLRHGHMTESIMDELRKSIHHLETVTGKSFTVGNLPREGQEKSFQDGVFPLLLSIRSSASMQMPGMMSTILNLGMNESMMESLARVTKNRYWALDTYRRFLQMFGELVFRVSKEHYKKIIEDKLSERHVEDESELSERDLMDLIRKFRSIGEIPDDPWRQLELAVDAMFISWNSPRAMKYRDIHNIPNNIGAAVVVQSMVFGNVNKQSGSGIVSTRNPMTGEKKIFGEYLTRAEGEDIFTGRRVPQSLDQMKHDQSYAYDMLMQACEVIEKYYRDMQDIEFTVENGELFILQTRAAERSPLASTKIAVDLVTEKHITEREALQRIDPESMNCFLYPMVDLNYVAKNVQEVEQRRMSKGVTASPGVVSGSVVFTAEDVMQCKKSGQPFVFCKPDTVEDDMPMLQHAIGVLTTHGGLTSHAAVVMRGMGKTAVTGARDIIIDVHNKQLKTRDGKICLSTGDLITIDGSTGYVYRGEMPTVSSGHSQDFQTILQWADKYKNMHVLANADTAEEAKKALELGAEGIGLCRTEHMFFKEGQLQLFRKYVLSESESDKELALASLIRPFETEFMQLFRVMHGRLVAIRLLDPPAHDFFPDPSSSDFQDQIMEMAGKSGISVEHCRNRILEMQEKNPMLGCRGSRMAIMHPEIIKMQMKAMTRAMIYAYREGNDVDLQIIIPMIFSDHEIDAISTVIDRTIFEVCTEMGVDRHNYSIEIGAMMEVPRACMRAEKISQARGMRFVTFGSDELTQLIFGLGREDKEHFMTEYLENHILAHDPFKSIDIQGVGSLIQLATNKCRRAKPDMQIGVTGDHAGDPRSIRFFSEIGIDTLSCSPFQVPCAKIAAAKAQIAESAISNLPRKVGRFVSSLFQEET